MQMVYLFREIWHIHRKLLFLISALLVCNVLFYVVLQQFFVPRVVEREQSFIRKQSEARQLLRQSGGFADTPGQLFNQAQRDIAEFFKVIPEHRDFTGLIDELLMLAYRADLTIAQISYNPKVLKKVDLLQYELSFTVNGRYEQVKKFIHSLEQSPRIMGIQQINLSSVGEAGQAEVGVRLNLETVFHSEARES
jgi:type IV pilus assembly protein PilO